MDECTHIVRAEYWKEIISQCQQRPAEQSAKQWLDQNGIREQSYYYWQKKLRQQAFDQMNNSSELLPAVKETKKTDFVELSFPLSGKAESSATLVLNYYPLFRWISFSTFSNIELKSFLPSSDIILSPAAPG